VRARHVDRIGVAALGGQALAFVPAYPELLGKVLRVVLIAVVHDVPA
jgi:hypothetical protein